MLVKGMIQEEETSESFQVPKMRAWRVGGLQHLPSLRHGSGQGEYLQLIQFLLCGSICWVAAL